MHISHIIQNASFESENVRKGNYILTYDNKSAWDKTVGTTQILNLAISLSSDVHIQNHLILASFSNDICQEWILEKQQDLAFNNINLRLACAELYNAEEPNVIPATQRITANYRRFMPTYRSRPDKAIVDCTFCPSMQYAVIVHNDKVKQHGNPGKYVENV